MSLLVDPVPTRVEFPTGSVTVLRAGAQTTLQDVTGRTGYWDVGVPPSGATGTFMKKLMLCPSSRCPMPAAAP